MKIVSVSHPEKILLAMHDLTVKEYVTASWVIRTSSWSRISMDFLSSQPTFHNNYPLSLFLLLFLQNDAFHPSSYIPVLRRNHGDPSEVCLLRLPWDLVSDRGPQFCLLLRVVVTVSSGFHLESNGQSEMLNQQLELSLPALFLGSASWCRVVLWTKHALNTTNSPTVHQLKTVWTPRKVWFCLSSAQAEWVCSFCWAWRTHWVLLWSLQKAGSSRLQGEPGDQTYLKELVVSVYPDCSGSFLFCCHVQSFDIISSFRALPAQFIGRVHISKVWRSCHSRHGL